MKRPDCLEIYSDPNEYDADHGEIKEDIPFYLSEARKAKGDVLELACGTGRVTLPLAQAGIKITGIDISRPMLALAKAKAHNANLLIHYKLADIRKFDLKKKFSLIFVPLNAVQHLHDLASLEMLLACVKKHLTPDGKFIFTLWNPPLKALSTYPAHPIIDKKVVDYEGKKCRVEIQRHYNSITQIRSATLSIICGKKILKTMNYGMRCYYPQEILALLKYNGFKVIHHFGSFDRTKITEDDTKQILACRLSSSF